jgi:hypothetical protein
MTHGPAISASRSGAFKDFQMVASFSTRHFYQPRGGM